MKKQKIIFIIILILVIVIGIGIYLYYNKEEEITDIVTESTEIYVEYDEEVSSDEYTTTIMLQDDNTTVTGNGVTVSSNTITINSEGVYYITGTLTDGNIIIDANKSADVILVLSNVNITSKTTAVINGVKANKVTITLEEGTTNYLTDSDNYTYFTDTEDDEPDATIFSKTDLVINGSGNLIINANYLDGIASKDTLKISNSNISITSNDDGIRGKDYVGIYNATIEINSDGDGIKSTNTNDTSLGFIKIEDSNINITTQRDGIQAETIVNVSNSEINIVTDGDISNTAEDISSKGIKAGTEVTIESGTIIIDSTDDALHSNGILIIEEGTFTLESGDDGIHADTNIVINGGTINITNSYEGIESSYIEINDGNISIVSSDDGINISGGSDSSAFGDRPGQNNFSSVGDSNQKLIINGGTIYVRAEGDGLDANGSIYINGGNITIAGPTSSGNGSFDYDNECVISGGTIIAYGATGMWESPSSTSTQYGIVFSSSGSSGDEIVITNSSGEEISSFTTDCSYGIVFISTSEIEEGETYTLYVNGSSSSSVTVNSTISGSTSNGMQGGSPGNQGGGMQRETQGSQKNSGGRSR